jgi:glycosyltransferase involved in cell wall biosynthesis
MKIIDLKKEEELRSLIDDNVDLRENKCYISAAIICKQGTDEADVERLLESIYRSVDEIVMFVNYPTEVGIDFNYLLKLDPKFNPVISYGIWNDDFSEARNYVKSNCNGEYIIFFDTDEVLIDPDFNLKRAIRDISENMKEHNIGLIQIMFNDFFEGKVVNKYFLPRIIKNDLKIKYIAPVHEHFEELNVEYGLMTIEETQFYVEHYGYDSVEKRTEKLERNLRIMNKWLESNPDDKLILQKRAEQFYHNDNPAGAYLDIEKAISNIKGGELGDFHTLNLGILIAASIGNWQRVKEWAEKSIDLEKKEQGNIIIVPGKERKGQIFPRMFLAKVLLMSKEYKKALDLLIEARDFMINGAPQDLIAFTINEIEMLIEECKRRLKFITGYSRKN